MSVFTHIDFDQHEQVVYAYDAQTGLKAIIAIHNTQLGPAMGGCRMWAYANENDALTDALRLARGMTYKNAVAQLPIGGGKAVVIGNAKTDKTPELFQALGEAIQHLGGRYITAEDVGTSPADMREVNKTTRFVLGTSQETGDPSPFTALGCFVGAQAAIKHRLNRTDFDGLTVALQGLGHVGWHYAKYLREAGAKLVVTDIDNMILERAKHELNAEIVTPDAIYDVDADIYAPCALGATVNESTLARLKCKIIAGAANNQLKHAVLGEAVRNKGILYAPDFVINAGGIIKVCYDYLGKSLPEIDTHVRKIHHTLLEVFERADSEDLPTSVIADQLAEARFKQEHACLA
ncbi:Glu/Leu/Phe/Val dehydrogenase dimerization domain-containing protein [Chitinivorax sp. B]|uniref:Glu/Leu/Phe/Val family dehydrogenase n=1 Tax=Chitinivorax sp. B TaxID=2502235 RepID=UPI0010F4D2C5|nr:Glu/Leu/Phe/Val dehydrogenase dimerization domain-containing protein [Chitinivorax sp. B]